MLGDRELKRTRGKSAGRKGISEAAFHGPGSDRTSVETVRVMSASAALSLLLTVVRRRQANCPEIANPAGRVICRHRLIVVDTKADLSAEQLTELFLTHQIEAEIEKTWY